jgi:hypothetical protein
MDLHSFLTPLHLLSFSTLLGTQLYQTFVVTKICYVALPRSAFTTLQKRLFPIYFRSQSLLLVLVAVTIPSQGLLTLTTNKAAGIPFTIAGVTTTLNLVIYGPQTRQIMIDRIRQGTSMPATLVVPETYSADSGLTVWPETRDGQRQPADASNEASPEMQRLRRSFSHNHAMSIHLNLLAIGAMLWWGWKLASNLDLKLQ